MRGVRGVLLMIVGTGCFYVTSTTTEPAPRSAEVEVEVFDGASHAYDVAVTSAGDSFLVTWTEHRMHAGDSTASPDIYYALAGAEHDAPTSTMAFTPYAQAQLQSRPFCASSGCGVVWGDDAPAGFPDRRLAWQLLDAGPLTASSAAHPTSNVYTHQRSPTRVAVLGDRAMIAYAVTSGKEHVWHASFLDLGARIVSREVTLGIQHWQTLHSVTAGASSFLVLYLDGANGEKQRMSAVAFDSAGELVAGPILLADRMPSDVHRPPTAGFHAGEFVVPVLDYEVVEVDRPCCPTCAVVQPPTCVIEDYHLYVTRLDEATWTAGSLECLDCRTDVGVHAPMVATTADGVYWFWDEYLALVTATDTPKRDEWRQVMFPEQDDAFVHRELHDLGASQERVVLVGRQRDLGSTTPMSAFVARVAH